MKKTLLLCLNCLLVLCATYSHVLAQCTDYAAGPYSDQGAIDVSGCNGTSVQAAYQAWENEVYFSTVVAGGNYTIALTAPGACNATNWGDDVTITAIEGGTPTDDAAPAGGPGSIVGGSVVASTTGCSLTFTATTTGTVYFVFSTETSCNGAITQTDNGTPTFTTNSGVSCDVCGNGTCNALAGESYCNCGQQGGDCACTVDDIGVELIGLDATGALTISAEGDPSVLRCADDFTTGTPPASPAVYITLAYFGGPCLGQTDGNNPPAATSPWVTATADFGTVVNAPGTPVTTQPELFIFFLELTQAQINASGGTVTITFGDETAGSNCALDFAIDLTAWGSTSTLVADNCVPCNDDAGTLTGPAEVCFNETFTINSTGASFDPSAANDGILYGLFTADGPSVGFENNVTTDPNFIGVLGDDSDNTILNDIFTDGGTAVIAPITYEGVDAGTGNYLLGDCHHVGTGFNITFIPEITISGFLSCNLDLTVSGGVGNDGYNYTLSGPDPATTQVASGDASNGILYEGSPGDYTLVLTDVATGCTETYIVTIAPNNDSPGDASGDAGAGASTAITVCYDGTYSIMTEGAIVGSDTEFFSNILGWGVSTVNPSGDINAIDVAFIPTNDPAQVLNFTNNGDPLAGAFNPDGTPFTGSLTPGNTYYFTPFTMFDLPGTPFATQSPGDTFGAGGDGADASGTIDLAYSFYVDGASPTGSGFSINQLCFDITHSWIGDVNIYLLSPDGTLAQLFAIDPNSDGNDFTACFVPTGGATIADPCAEPDNCFSGNLAPLEALYTAGENPNGFWTIIIDDTFGDTDPVDGGGTLNTWSVTVSGGTAWDENGNFPFPVWDGDCHLAGSAVQVNLAEPISVTATATACGFTATYEAATEVSWQVTNAGGTIITNGTGTTGSISGSVGANGTYTLSIMDGNNCEAADEFTVAGCISTTCPTVSNFTQTLSQACSGSSVTLCADVNYGTFPGATVLFSDGTTSVAGTGTGGTPTIHTIQVGQGGFNFVPNAVNAQVGDIIRWVWANGSHTTTSDAIPAGATPWSHPLSGAGQQFEYTVTTPGTYSYHCEPHQSLGMVGTITVSAAAATTVCATIQLSNTTCTSVVHNYTASFDATTIGTCANTTLGPLGVTVYPAITATGVSGTCSASVTVNCPNFGVTYSSPAGSGSGTTATITPSTVAQNGTVTFTVTQIGAAAGCASATATANYACPAAACPTISGQAVSASSICSGASVSLTNGDITGGSAGAAIAWAYSSNAAFDPYTEGTAYSGEVLTTNGCETTTYHLKAYLTGVSGCQVSSTPFAVMVYPAISAMGMSGTCSASVMVNCPNFTVTYSSPAGSGSGTMLTLTPTATAQTGTVTFTVTQTGAPAGCASATATANYDCAATVCSSLNGLQSVTSTSICSNSSVTLQNGSVIDGSFTGGSVVWSYSTNAGFDPYTEGTAYSGQALTASGCNPSTYHFKARLAGVAGCQDVEGPFAVMVYPNIVALPINGSCGASINIVGGCTNYTVSYTTSNGDSGEGSAYNVTPSTTAQSGSVTFTIINPALAVGTTCSSAQITATYECAALICAQLDGTQDLDFSATCSGQGIGFVSGGIIVNDFPGGSVAVKYSTDMNFDPYSTGTAFNGSLPANTTCAVQSYYIKFYLAGIAGCQDVSTAFEVMVYPAISGIVTNSDPDDCSAATLNLSCPFAVTWVDALGATGSGTSYQPADGAIGLVTFTATQAGAPGNCGSRNFTATYNCSGLVCAILDGGQAVAEGAICSGQALTLANGSVIDNDFAGGSVTWVYSTQSGFNSYNSGTVFSGQLPANSGCEVMNYFVRARLDGVVGCQDQSDEFTVSVYPNIAVTANNGTCSASVSVNCPNFEVSYVVGAGPSVIGSVYNATAGESGTVTFTVIQADAPAACVTATATASFDCPLIQCSVLDGTQSVAPSAICSGQGLTLSSGSVVDNSFTGGTVTWVYGTTADFDAYTEGTLFSGTLPDNMGCDAMTYYLKARLDGIAECEDQSDAFMVMVYPAIIAEVAQDACGAIVMAGCDYEVMWDNTTTGESGVGSSYTAIPGESALVIFTVSQVGAPSACVSLTLFAELNCPEIPCTPNDAGACDVMLLSSLEGGRTSACSGDGFMAMAIGVAVNDPNYTSGFILYSDLADPAGSLLSFNTDGVFANDGSYPVGETLYIASAVLTIPFGANFSGDCSALSEPEEVMFLAPLTIELVGYDCDFDSGTYTATLSISGGDGNYSINGMAIAGSSYISGAIPSGGTYNFVVTDGAGCVSNIGGEYVCVVAPQPPVAENATYTLSILAGLGTYSLADLTSDPNGDALTYVILGYEPSTGGILDFDAATGIFTFLADVSAVGQSVVITYTVSDGDFAPVQATVTLNITDQLTCELLAPISAVLAVEVNQPAMVYTLYINVTGGLPDIDDTEYTVTLNDGTNNLVQQAAGSSVTVFENVPAASPSLVAAITITDELGCSLSLEEAISISLSVEILSFTGEVLDNGNLLRWATASEINNDHFTLLRAADGIHYTAIATLNGAGNSSTTHGYDFLDKTAPAGLSYYRLDQTDMDGTTRTASYLTLTRGATGLQVVSISPVPASDVVSITFNGQTTDNTVATVFDVTGRMVETRQVSGINQLQLNVQHYAAGTYFLTLQNADGTATVKFVKQ